MLDQGLDLEQLARDAVARGADCLGMAGGDGSQALVASIAVEHGLPFVCVSAGRATTSRSISGSTATTPASRCTRSATRTSARSTTPRSTTASSSTTCRSACTPRSCRRTRTATPRSTPRRRSFPRCSDDQAEPFDLQFTTPDGNEVDGAILVMVSNNPYVIGASPDNAQRRQLDSGAARGLRRDDAHRRRGRAPDRRPGARAAVTQRVLEGVHRHGVRGALASRAPRSPASTARRSSCPPRCASGSTRKGSPCSSQPATSRLPSVGVARDVHVGDLLAIAAGHEPARLS